jgi:hypothetical protein
MNYFFSFLFLILLVTIQFGHAQTKTLPFLKKNGNATQLVVDGKPFLMISGELHNSSSSSVEYMKPIWPKLKAMNLNSVIASISWEQFEPEEGTYDYTLVEALIKEAKAYDLKLCLIWFASWKNGESSYMPMWVKRDTKRFFRVKDKNGNNIETVSPFCEEAMRADAKAFGMLMKHIRKIDHEHTVIMMQPENEVGIFQDIDYNKQALKKYNQEVPARLISYLKEHVSTLKPEIKSLWQINGSKMQGSWKSVFGDNPSSKEFMMAWQYASYINEVAKSGKQEHPLPMFVNAWLVQKPDDLPGVYPNGGPVSRVMDIYKAAAPEIDIVSPDIYLPNFKEICSMYHRSDNPLLIPESRMIEGWAFYAFAAHDAICLSPFGIESGASNFTFSKAYQVLNELMPVITQYQGTGKMVGVLMEGNEKDTTIVMGNYRMKVVYDKNGPSYGLFIQTGEDEFLISGVNLKVFVSSADTNRVAYVGQVWEGSFENGIWKSMRLLNGDETWGWPHRIVNVFGRQFDSTEKLATSAEIKPDSYSAKENKIISTAGIYKVITYLRDK